jgi:hypothetical protein
VELGVCVTYTGWTCIVHTATYMYTQGHIQHYSSVEGHAQKHTVKAQELLRVRCMHEYTVVKAQNDSVLSMQSELRNFLSKLTIMRRIVQSKRANIQSKLYVIMFVSFDCIFVGFDRKFLRSDCFIHIRSSGSYTFKVQDRTHSKFRIVHIQSSQSHTAKLRITQSQLKL